MKKAMGFLSIIIAAFAGFLLFSALSNNKSLPNMWVGLKSAYSTVTSTIFGEYSSATNEREATVTLNLDSGNSSASEQVRAQQSVPSGPRLTYTSQNHMASTGIEGIQVYEYGKSLLSAQQQGYYDKIADAVLNMDTSLAISTSVEPKELQKIISYYIADHVESFYYTDTSISYIYKEVGSARVYSKYTINFSYSYDSGTVSSMRQEISSCAQPFLAAAKGKSSDTAKEKALHDSLINNCSYDSPAVDDPDTYKQSYSIYGAIVSGKAVCEGYAKTMKLFLDTSGVKSLYVSGTTSINGEISPLGHAWNIVSLSGKWYYTDATFDDPIQYSVNGKPTGKNVITEDYLYFTSTTEPEGTTHTLSTFDSDNPFEAGSCNYETMPVIG